MKNANTTLEMQEPSGQWKEEQSIMKCFQARILVLIKLHQGLIITRYFMVKAWNLMFRDLANTRRGREATSPTLASPKIECEQQTR